MARMLTVGAAQLGPIQRADSRASVVKRLTELLRQAASHGCQLVVFPELALTTFFPRWWMTEQEEIDSFFEREMPSNETAPLFNEAQRLGLGFYLGFAELDATGPKLRRFNTAILVDRSGRIAGRYRKVHCRVTPSTSRGGPFSTWRSAISRSATWASACGARWMPMSACASAMTGDGRRPIA